MSFGMRIITVVKLFVTMLHDFHHWTLDREVIFDGVDDQNFAKYKPGMRKLTIYFKD